MNMRADYRMPGPGGGPDEGVHNGVAMTFVGLPARRFVPKMLHVPSPEP